MDILNRLQPGVAEETAFEDDHLVDSPFIVIQRGKRRSGKTRGAQAVQAGEVQSVGQAEEEAFDHVCFQGVEPSTSKGEAFSNGGRGRMFDDFLNRLEENVKLNMQHADEHVFEGVMNLAKRSSRRPAKGSDKTIPTGLVFAGGVNSADHSRIFPALKEYLEAGGCRVALLSPLAFTGKTLSFTLAKMFDQMQKTGEDMSGHLDGGRDYFIMDDMVEWYKTYARGQGGKESQPLVIIVESVETTRSETLQDFIHVLHERCSSIPHLLLLGLTTTRETLADALPHSIIDRCLTCYDFELASAMMQFESFVANVLVKNWNGLLLHFRSYHSLMDTFFLHHFTVSAIYRGMKLAAADTLVNHPCASLVYKSLESKQDFRAHLNSVAPEEMDAVWRAIYRHTGAEQIKEILSGFPQDQPGRKGRKRNQKSDTSIEDFFALYCDFRTTWEMWRLAFELLTEAGMTIEGSSSFSCWKNYEPALNGDFAMGQLSHLLDVLRTRSSVLSDEYIEQLQRGVEDLFEKRYKRSEWLPDDAVTMIENLRAALGEPVQDNHLDEARDDHKTLGSSKKENSKHRVNKSEKTPRVSNSKGACPKPAGGANPPESSKASRWTNALCRFFEDILEKSPLNHPIAPLFCCALDPNSLSEYLVASTRKNVHLALRHPQTFYPDKVLGTSMGTHGAEEDTCIVYTLFDEDPSCSNLVDWYLSFEEVLEEGSRAHGKEAGKTDKSSKKEKIARFSQSLQDLQFIGMIQSSKRKKGDHAQRSIFQPSLEL